MGAAESSTLSLTSQAVDEITTVSERSKEINPILEKLKVLKVTTPILTSLPTESSLTDLLVRKPSSTPPADLFGNSLVDVKVLLELFTLYRDWQTQETQQITKKQEEIKNKIELADALAVKLLQRFNYSVSAFKTTSHYLSEVDLGELKERLTEVISNCMHYVRESHQRDLNHSGHPSSHLQFQQRIR